MFAPESLQPLGWVDWIIVVVYLLFIAGLGISFTKRQKSTDRYFAGGRSVPTWAVGLSILATLISSITFLAYPGEGYKTNWIRLVQGLMVPIVLLFLVWFIVPMYRKIIGLSTYEYFEKRFGLIARLYTSLAFTLMHFSKMGTVFFLLSLAIATMLGLGGPQTYYVIVILGTLVVIYTLLGGIEAVIWCDVVQGLLLMVGGLVCVGILLFGPEGGGPVEMLSRAWHSTTHVGPYEVGKISLGPFKWDFVNLTFWVMAINGIFYAIQKYGTDQTIVQRYLTAQSDKKAIKAALVGVLLCVPVWTLFIFIGSLLWSYYQANPMPEDIKAWAALKPERAFIYFITNHLPMGLSGLILAALCAAALSSLDSDLNCLSAVLVEDYYRRIFPRSTDRQRLWFGRLMVALCGLAAIGVACLYVRTQGKSVLSIVFALYAIFSSGIVGIFVLGFLTRRANRQGLYFGMVACVLFTAWALLTSKPIIGDKKLLDLTFTIGGHEFALNYTHHKYMLGVYSHIVMFVVGYVASLFFKPDKDIEKLTYYGWLHEKRSLRELTQSE